MKSLTVHQAELLTTTINISLLDIHYLSQGHFRWEAHRIISMLFVVLLQSPLRSHGDISIAVTSLVCCLKYICIPNAANFPTLISNPVTIYCSSSDNDEVFIMCTDEGVGCRLLHHSGTLVTPVGDIMYVSVSMTRADTCLQRDRHRALTAV